MKEYTAIGSMLYGTGGESFKRGILGGVSRTLKAHNSNTMIVLAREIEDEIHLELQQRLQREGAKQASENYKQHHPRQ